MSDHAPGRPAAGFLVVVLMAACARQAHISDTWLVPRFHQAGAPGAVGFALTSGMGFPAHEFPMRPERIESSGMRLAGITRPLGGAARGAHALLLSAAAPARGIAAAFVVLKAREFVLDETRVHDYLRAIHAESSAGKVWASLPNPKTWRESSRRIAKTFFTVGDAGPDPSWQEPLGLPLEIVPGADPAALRAGDSLSVVVLKEGKPFPGLVLRATSAPGQDVLATTDATGRAVFALDRAGAWLFAGTDLRRAGDDWESDFTTLTVEVGATVPAGK